VRIKIFTTGGSLDKGHSTRKSAFIVMEPRVGRVPGDAHVAFDYEIEPLLRKDSLESADLDRFEKGP
jgi:L-asparaginase